MELDGLARRIQLRRHLRHFTAERLHVRHALGMIECDNGSTAAKPAEGLAERDVKINREIAWRAIVLLNFRGKLFPRNRVGEFRGRGIAGVTWAGHVVLLYQIQI